MEKELIIETNEFQTSLTRELLDSLPFEVQEELLYFIKSVPLINNLINPLRKRAKDLERDKDGKIIIDFTNPHILEDMDYFRPSAIHFQKHGCYTFLKPNSNPNSDYGIWFNEEKRRCWDGLVRKSDGEWIPGILYWYMNYSPIKLSRLREGTKISDRVIDFPRIWEGIYLRFHYINKARSLGLNGAELAKRGASKSYSMSSILAHNFIVGENSEAKHNTLSSAIAYNKEYLIKDGLLNKYLDIVDFVATNTQFPRKRIKSSLQDMSWKMGYKDLETNVEKGTKNEIIGVSISDDVSKIRGKRSCFIGIEEFGSFRNLIDLYNILGPSTRDGNIVFGLMYLMGTSGDKESDFAGACEIMYNPEGYYMLPIENVYDITNQGKKKFVFFFPGYMNREGCYNENGVSDVIKALIEILLHRYKVKYNSTDPNTIIRIIAEVPITPSEAILKHGDNLFPVREATETLNNLDNNPNSFNDILTGDIGLDSKGNLKYLPTSDIPIRNFPFRNSSTRGSIEFIKMPEKDNSGKVFANRYIGGLDPVDDDSGTSLCSLYILDLWTDSYVCYYTGRPTYADDFYEMSRRICLFYNVRMNYENNKKGLFSYYSKMNSLYLLTDTLDFLKDKELAKGGLYGNKLKGTTATSPVNIYGRTLFRNWLIEPVIIQEMVEDEYIQKTIPRIYTLKDRALLEEIITYNKDGNFDRISANILLMLLREDMMIKCNGNAIKYKDNSNDNSYLGCDKFFTSNYDDKFKHKFENI